MIEFSWDPWQLLVLRTKGNMAICAGRQVGKSTIISKDAGDYAMNNKKKVIMIIASTERQALLLFEKVLSYIHGVNKNCIKKGKDRPTKHTLKLINGTVIHCLPTGDSGYGIRGYTIDRLYADEAHFIKEEVWAAVSPMLATTGGDIILLSTPFGCEGYFYRCFHDKKFTSIHVNTEEVAKGRSEPQQTNMLNFLKDEKERMTKLQYQQEYLGLFVGGIQRFFPDELIEESCTLESHKPLGDKFMGIDVARMGGDETVLTSVDRINRKNLYQFDLTIPEPQRLTDTTRLIIHKDKLLDHKKIYIDDGGLGVGVFDSLMEDKQTKRKTVAINNAKRLIDKEKSKKGMKDRKKPLMKEALYTNLKNLMENNKIKLLDNPQVRQSLRSIQMDYGDGKLKIYGNYSHIAEALIRAAWCMKDKTLNIMAFC
jgi:hypothetical protein